MPYIPSRDAVALVLKAQLTLGVSQKELGAILGISRRTVSRMASNLSDPTLAQLQRLARAVHPRDASLAAALAAEGATSLEDLGLVRVAPPAAPPAPPSRPFPPVRLLVESVVCAAAEAMQAPPMAVRNVLRSALARAHALGLSVEEMNEALAPPESGPPSTPSRRKRAATD
jgi:transcriptional regulator with XRE-family HTH domain